MLYFLRATGLDGGMMDTSPLRAVVALALCLTGYAASGKAVTSPVTPKPDTPAAVVAQAPVGAWRDIPADELLVMTIEGGRRVVIQLAPAYAAAHVANIRALARARWWDGTSINRVQDNYVVQWGDATEEKPLPPGVAEGLPQAYVRSTANVRLAVTPLGSSDSYAPGAGFVDGWPVAMNADTAWLPHCYAMVGVGRNSSPDAGTGAELYAVIGHAPRQLDRNIAVVGRVIEGMQHLASLPRGSGELSFYTKDEHQVPILSVRLVSELHPADRPAFQVMDTLSPTFADYLRLRGNRKDDFYSLPAGGVDLCNAPVPVRVKP